MKVTKPLCWEKEDECSSIPIQDAKTEIMKGGKRRRFKNRAEEIGRGHQGVLGPSIRLFTRVRMTEKGVKRKGEEKRTRTGHGMSSHGRLATLFRGCRKGVVFRAKRTPSVSAKRECRLRENRKW